MADPLDSFEPEPRGGTHQWFVGLLAAAVVLAVISVVLFGRSGMDHGSGSSATDRQSQIEPEFGGR